MAAYVIAGPVNSVQVATPVVTVLRIGDGYIWDRDAAAFAATPDFDDCKYTGTALTGAWAGFWLFDLGDITVIDGLAALLHDDDHADDLAVAVVGMSLRASDMIGNPLAKESTAQSILDDTAEIGNAGAGLTALGDTRLGHLDADVSSRAAPGDQMTLPDGAIPTAEQNADAVRTELATELARLDVNVSELWGMDPTEALANIHGTLVLAAATAGGGSATSFNIGSATGVFAESAWLDGYLVRVTDASTGYQALRVVSEHAVVMGTCYLTLAPALPFTVASGDTIDILSGWYRDVNLTTWRGTVPGLLVSSSVPARVTSIANDAVSADAVAAAAVTKIQAGIATSTAQSTAQDSLDDLTGRLTAERGSYLDNLNVGGAVASQADVNALNQSASRRIVISGVQQFERPTSATISYTIEVRTYAPDGSDVNADETPVLTATGNVTGDLSDNLSSASNPGTGRYLWIYTLDEESEIEQITFSVSAEIDSAVFTISHYAQVTDFVAETFTANDRNRLAAIYNKLPSKTYLTGTSNADGDIQANEMTGNFGGTVAGVAGNVSGSVGSVSGNVGGNVVGSVGSVTGNVGGNIAGSVASVSGNVGGTVNGLTATAQGHIRTAVGLATADLDTQLAALPTDADVNAQVAAALATYDPPTKAEMDSALSALQSHGDDEWATGNTTAPDNESIEEILDLMEQFASTLEEEGGSYRFTEEALQNVPTGFDPDTDAVRISLDQELPATPVPGTTGEALVGARAQAFGNWDLNLDTQVLTLYAPDGTTILHQFTIAPSLTTPLSRTTVTP